MPRWLGSLHRLLSAKDSAQAYTLVVIPGQGTETQWAVMHESSKVKNSPHLHEMAHAPRQEVSLPELSRWGPGRCRGILNSARRYKGLLRRLCSWRCALLSRLHGAYGPGRLVEVC